VATKLDDVWLDHLDDLKTHEGYNLVRLHIEQERARTMNEVAGQKLDLYDTAEKRGFLQGLNFCLEARKQVYDQRLADLEQPKKGKR
jgi:hypothetical protein